MFDAMVERAVRLCEADAATVRTFDGELLHLAAAHAEPRMMKELRRLGPSHLNWLYEPLSRGERVIHIPDVRETAAYREIPGARERLDRRGIRSWLAVALCKDGALLGVLNASAKRLVWLKSNKQVLSIFLKNATFNIAQPGDVRSKSKDLRYTKA